MTPQKITAILHSRYSNNLSDKETAQEYNMSISFIKSITSKYGKIFMEANGLSNTLPDLDKLEAFWSSNKNNNNNHLRANHDNISARSALDRL